MMADDILECECIDTAETSVLEVGMTGATGNTGGGGFFSLQNFIHRIKRPDFIIVYLALLISAILLAVLVYFGDSTDWYLNLVQPNVNTWLVRGLWLLGTILSYVAFYFIWEDVTVHVVPRDLIVSTFFVVTGFLFLAWALALYYAQDIAMSLWIAVIIFIYNYWIFIYVWHIKPIAAVFLLPNMLLYVYLIYNSIHLASINKIPI